MLSIEKVIIENQGPRLAGLLCRPPAAGETPLPAVIVCHGLGSRKERHQEFAEYLCARGFAALVIDARGHGESEGALDGNEMRDIAAWVRYLMGRPDIDASRLSIRGSSLGGHWAIHAGALMPELRAVVAICPAPEALLYKLLEPHGWPTVLEGEGLYARLDVPAFQEYLKTHSVYTAAPRISPRSLFLIHARGDAEIPYRVSEELYAVAGEPKRLVLQDGGSHSSAQHDPAVHAMVVQWLREQLGIGRVAGDGR